MDAPLLLAAAANFAAAGIWALVGLRLLRRDHLPEHKEAGLAFAWCWLSGAAYSAVNGAVALVSAFAPDALPGSVVLAAAWICVVLAFGLVGGFVAHILHLLVGGPRTVRRVLVAYVVQLAVVVAILLALGPTGATTRGWMLRFEFTRAPEVANAIIAVAVLLPALLASASYWNLARDATTPTARWRLSLVGGGATLWVLTVTAARLTPAIDPLLAAGRVIGAVAALAVLAAYSPPAFARRRWGVQSLRDEITAPGASPQALQAKREALAARVRDLV